MHEHFKTETNIRHVRVILRGDNYRKGKFGKFFKSKFKILTCVVLLGWCYYNQNKTFQTFDICFYNLF